MTKKVIYKQREYDIEIKWATSGYFIRIDSFEYKPIPIECAKDLAKLKFHIIEAIEELNRPSGDFNFLQNWDGVLDDTSSSKYPHFDLVNIISTACMLHHNSGEASFNSEARKILQSIEDNGWTIIKWVI